MPGEKTEKATPKRKQDERKKGNIFMSREVVTVFSLLAVFTALRLLLPGSILSMEEFVAKYINMGSEIEHLGEGELSNIFIDSIMLFASVALPILVVAMMAGVIVTMAQTKMLFSAKAFAFKGERINPLKGFKRMISLRSLVELVKSSLKIAVLIYIFYTIFSSNLEYLPNLMSMDFNQALAVAGTMIFDIVLLSGGIFAFLAAADYFYQWWQYEKNLRMSKQEIKDEYKQMEGDPQVKAHIRSLQQQIARRRMIQQVPEADVVIRNPTHFAVAVKYDKEKHAAPVVVAKGTDALALRIIEVAEQNNVHVTENRPLARALFENVDLDAPIPFEYYQAIAEILAFIYKLKKDT